MSDETVFCVRDLPIKLGQLLKLAELVQDGFEAKVRIQYGEVSVNGVTATQRGKKIAAGDLVCLGATSLRITSHE